MSPHASVHLRHQTNSATRHFVILHLRERVRVADDYSRSDATGNLSLFTMNGSKEQKIY